MSVKITFTLYVNHLNLLDMGKVFLMILMAYTPGDTGNPPVVGDWRYMLLFTRLLVGSD